MRLLQSFHFDFLKYAQILQKWITKMGKKELEKLEQEKSVKKELSSLG